MTSILALTAFQFLLVVTNNSQDIVFVNQDIPGQEFNFGEVTCAASIESKDDPTVAGQLLGTLVLSCKHGTFPIQTSVTCSVQDPAAQNHFEFGEGKNKFSFDLLCKARAK